MPICTSRTGIDAEQVPVDASEYYMYESSVNYQGQSTLPKAVRDSLAVKAGDKVRYVILDEGVFMMRVRPTSRLFGSLKYDSPVVA